MTAKFSSNFGVNESRGLEYFNLVAIKWRSSIQCNKIDAMNCLEGQTENPHR